MAHAPADEIFQIQQLSPPTETADEATTHLGILARLDRYHLLDLCLRNRVDQAQPKSGVVFLSASIKVVPSTSMSCRASGFFVNDDSCRGGLANRVAAALRIQAEQVLAKRLIGERVGAEPVQNNGRAVCQCPGADWSERA